jgi:hypothetical protein
MAIIQNREERDLGHVQKQRLGHWQFFALTRPKTASRAA